MGKAEIVRLGQQYRELLRLKNEINQRLGTGTDFQSIKDLMLYLAKERTYAKLKSAENQLIVLESFFNIWLKEKRKLPELGIDTDIFDHVFSLKDVEQKYQRIKFCGLRIENNVPEECCEQGIEWLREDKVSGLAIGKIIVDETKNREKNLLYIARGLKEKGDLINAVLLLQYANEAFPGQEKLLLEESKIWREGHQFERALMLLTKIDSPSQETEKLTEELRRVTGND